jgi:hypothetical protein
MTSAANNDPLTEPVIVKQFWKDRHRNKFIRVSLSRYLGRAVFDLRIFFTSETGHAQATKQGITLSIDKLPELREALERAEVKALDLDLIEAVS